MVPGDAQFALRAGLYEVQRLRDQGMTQADFKLTRDFVLNYSKLWAQSLDERLGFTMDSRFYGMPYYIDEIQAAEDDDGERGQRGDQEVPRAPTTTTP